MAGGREMGNRRSRIERSGKGRVGSGSSARAGQRPRPGSEKSVPHGRGASAAGADGYRVEVQTTHLETLLGELSADTLAFEIGGTKPEYAVEKIQVYFNPEIRDGTKGRGTLHFRRGTSLARVQLLDDVEVRVEAGTAEMRRSTEVVRLTVL